MHLNTSNHDNVTKCYFSPFDTLKIIQIVSGQLISHPYAINVKMREFLYTRLGQNALMKNKNIQNDSKYHRLLTT